MVILSGLVPAFGAAQELYVQRRWLVPYRTG